MRSAAVFKSSITAIRGGSVLKTRRECFASSYSCFALSSLLHNSITNTNRISSMMTTILMATNSTFQNLTSSQNRNYTSITFYNFVSRDLNNKKIDFSKMKGKVSLVAIVNTNHPQYKNFLRELAELKRRGHSMMNGGDFELIVIPRSTSSVSSKLSVTSDNSPLKQFLSTSSKENHSTEISSETSSSSCPSFTILKTIMNEEGSYINNEVFNFLANYGNIKTIVEDFEKFVIDSEGRVVYRSGNDTPLEEVVDVIKNELKKRK
ncbi:hypothetical protein FDP41_009532 [Naegleria fowleri]|uniref:Uncharacterized protein n=1 Tax=Naegleria fowleri TaxID=5763 RepID=A0A6A5BDS0_NAEFO|nr:uncharacterized protein FDP41_009532 [Naegleria fowleri]KAF0972224.1 hypothetical protein FDP41_009532 [Naegleria fowleri]CAG4708556.1 unnamed protein product [Naegleria fowleri]